MKAEDSGILDCDRSDSGLEDGLVMENSSGEGESDDGEGSEIVECTERVDKLDEVVEEETGSEEVQHGDDTVEEHGDEEVKHENDDTDTAVHDETETMNDLQVRITLDTEQYMNTCICTYNAISVIIITKQIHISGSARVKINKR